MNSSTSVASTTTAAGEWEPGAEPVLDVDQLGRRPADLDVEAGDLGADPLDERGRLRALRGAGRDEVDDGDARAACPDGSTHRRRRRADDTSASQAAKAGSSASAPATTVTGSVPRAGNRSDRASAVARTSDERGKRAGVAVLEAGTEERDPEQDEEQPGRRATDLQRPALHPAGQPVEPAVDVGRGRGSA